MEYYNVASRHSTKPVDVISCDQCGCTVMYKVGLNRYSPQTITLSVPPIDVHLDADFDVLVCAKCHHTVFPEIDGFNTQGAAYQLYKEMVLEICGTKEEVEKRSVIRPVVKQTLNVNSNLVNKPS